MDQHALPLYTAVGALDLDIVARLLPLVSSPTAQNAWDMLHRPGRFVRYGQQSDLALSKNFALRQMLYPYVSVPPDLQWMDPNIRAMDYNYVNTLVDHAKAHNQQIVAVHNSTNKSQVFEKMWPSTTVVLEDIPPHCLAFIDVTTMGGHFSTQKMRDVFAAVEHCAATVCLFGANWNDVLMLQTDQPMWYPVLESNGPAVLEMLERSYPQALEYMECFTARVQHQRISQNVSGGTAKAGKRI